MIINYEYEYKLIFKLQINAHDKLINPKWINAWRSKFTLYNKPL